MLKAKREIMRFESASNIRDKWCISNVIWQAIPYCRCCTTTKGTWSSFRMEWTRFQLPVYRLKILTNVEKSCSWYGISDTLVHRTSGVCMSKWRPYSLCATWWEANEAPEKSLRCWCVPVDMWQREQIKARSSETHMRLKIWWQK